MALYKALTSTDEEAYENLAWCGVSPTEISSEDMAKTLGHGYPPGRVRNSHAAELKQVGPAFPISRAQEVRGLDFVPTGCVTLGACPQILQGRGKLYSETIEWPALDVNALERVGMVR